MLNNLVRQFQKIAQIRSDELGQGFVRIACNIPFSLYAWYLFGHNTTLPNLALFLLVGNGNALLFLAHMLWRPKRSSTRILLGIINDQALITYFLYHAGVAGALYFFIFSFLTVGAGFRYGGRSLATAGGFGAAGILVLILFSPAWAKYPEMGWSVFIWHLMVSGYTGLLLNRLRVSQHSVVEGHAMLTSVIDNSPAVIFIKDNEGRYQLVNKKWEQSMGFSAAKMMGRKDHEIFPTPIADAFTKHDRIVIESDAFVQLEEHAPHADGVHTYFSIKFPIRNGEGKVVGIGGIATDVTENKKIEAERADLLIRERTAMEASSMKSSFLANMSHELRTPLNGIVGMADLMRMTILSGEQKSFNDTIAQCAESLITLVNDILDLSKAEAGKIELESIDFDLRKIAKDLETMLKLPAQRKGLELKFQVEDSVPRFLKADPNRIRQVLLNLMSNAIKFTEAGGIHAVIRAEPRDGRLQLRFEVQDTGIGITHEVRGRLFLPFSQADASTTRKFGGTGLGLSISKHLVDLMAGEIGVEPRLGGGTTFWFSLPIDEVRQLAAAPESLPLEQAHTGIKILIVEDNKVNQTVASRMLKSMGFENRVVDNGVEALKALNQSHFDLILMDCQMPEMDGYEATRMIRAGKTLSPADTRIIALTANAMAGDRERCLEAGMDDYLTKPMKIKELRSAIDRVMIKNVA